MCSILSAILNIGDIRIETDFHSHIGEVSCIANKPRLKDGMVLYVATYICMVTIGNLYLSWFINTMSAPPAAFCFHCTCRSLWQC